MTRSRVVELLEAGRERRRDPRVISVLLLDRAERLERIEVAVVVAAGPGPPTERQRRVGLAGLERLEHLLDVDARAFASSAMVGERPG